MKVQEYRFWDFQMLFLRKCWIYQSIKGHQNRPRKTYGRPVLFFIYCKACRALPEFSTTLYPECFSFFHIPQIRLAAKSYCASPPQGALEFSLRTDGQDPCQAQPTYVCTMCKNNMLYMESTSIVQCLWWTIAPIKEAVTLSCLSNPV